MSDRFFQEIFANLNSNLQVPIVVWEPGQVENTQTHWFSLNELRNDFTMPIDPDTLNQIYFCPHAYDSQNRKSSSAAEYGSCVWLESNDPYFRWQMVDEAAPSLVVKSSPERLHAYWFLDKPELLSTIVQINRALAEKYLSRDAYGWDLNQLMRVPGYVNRKRSVPYKVEIEHSDWNARYRLENFYNLKISTSSSLTNALREPEPPIPKAQDSGIIRQKYSAYFTDRFRTNLDSMSNDKSRSLWLVYNECFRMQMSPEEVYSLVRNSPNNLYAEQKYNAERDLWRDICRANRRFKNEETAPIVERIEEIRLSERKAEQKSIEIAQLVFEDMEQHGRFYFSPELKQGFYLHSSHLMRVSERTQRFRSFIDRKYQINPSTNTYRFVSEHVINRIVEEAPKVAVHTASFYDEQYNVLYVDSFDGFMYKLDGKEISRVPTGHNGILFLNVEKSEPINYLARTTKTSKLEELVLNLPNYDTNNNGLTQADATILVKAWVYSTFLLNRSKAILVLGGQPGSGKTTLFKAIEWVLTGPKADVYEVPPDPKSFRELIRQKHHVFLDGVDNISKWLQNLLSTIATGTEDRVRLLYTDNDTAQYALNAALGLSTMDANALRSDVVDRSVILTVSRFESFRSIETIHKNIANARGEIWSEILEELNDLIALKNDWSETSSRLRMANFFVIVSMLCSLLKVDAKPLEQYMKSEQSKTALSGDTVWDVLSHWLEVPDNVGREVSANQLHRELSGIGLRENIAFTRECGNARSLSKHLRNTVQTNLKEYQMVEGVNHSKSKTYTFERL